MFRLTTSALLMAAIAVPAAAVPLAFTDFNGRTLSGASSETATGLNWQLDGLADPGDMTALNAGGGAQTIADANELMQNIFAPLINTGNANTFWTTDIPITPAGGSAVTLTDVSFAYVPFSGAQALNVPRESDFIVSLISPSATEIDSVIVFETGGSGLDPETPTLTATFATPIELSEPGTYTLRIKGGDLFINDNVEEGPLAGKNETGNHTAIDNLSINGTLGGPALAGDTDGDGDVDDSDLGTSFSNYTGPVGDVGKTAADGDNDGDGDVDDSDLGTSFSNYTGPIAVAVPEPTSLALLGLGGLLAVRRRRHA